MKETKVAAPGSLRSSRREEGSFDEDVINHGVADDTAKEVMHHDPLVVPADSTLRLFEQNIRLQRGLLFPNPVDDLVVEPEEEVPIQSAVQKRGERALAKHDQLLGVRHHRCCGYRGGPHS